MPGNAAAHIHAPSMVFAAIESRITAATGNYLLVTFLPILSEVTTGQLKILFGWYNKGGPAT